MTDRDAAAGPPAPGSWRTDGFTEAGISVRDPGPWVELFEAVGCWEVLEKGSTDPALLALWPRAAPGAVYEILLGRPGSASGRLRLFHFVEGDAEIRGDTRPWDTGGIFDLDLRVANLPATIRVLRDRGWGQVADPVRWRFGELEIHEWLALGPEAVVLAFIQRLAPPLPEAAEMEGFGPVFNSTQTVADMERALAFYDHLGFKLILRHQGPLADGGNAVLGAEHDEPIDLAMVHPRGVVDGSVELVAFPGRPGRRVDEHAAPFGLGLNLLRFPVAGIDAFAAHLDDLGIHHSAVVRTAITGLDTVRLLALVSPEGAWLEFYEAL